MFGDDARDTTWRPSPIPPSTILPSLGRPRCPTTRVVVHDHPLLVEVGMASLFDLVVVVDAPEDVQVERLVTLRGMTEADARARLAAQTSREERVAVADVVLDNTGSIEDLEAGSTRSGPHQRVRGAPRTDEPAPLGGGRDGFGSGGCYAARSGSAMRRRVMSACRSS